MSLHFDILSNSDFMLDQKSFDLLRKCGSSVWLLSMDKEIPQHQALSQQEEDNNKIHFIRLVLSIFRNMAIIYFLKYRRTPNPASIRLSVPPIGGI